MPIDRNVIIPGQLRHRLHPEKQHKKSTKSAQNQHKNDTKSVFPISPLFATRFQTGVC